MQPPFTVRLGHVECTAPNQFFDIHSVGVEHTILVDVVIVNFNQAEAINVQIAIRTPTREIFRPLIWRPSLPPGSTVIELRQQILDGETLTVASSLALTHVWATGWVFQSP